MAVNKVVKSDGTTLIDISSTTATASDVAQGKTFFLADGTEEIGTAPGGGGASNYITGEFTAQSTTGVQTVNIPYTGSGYQKVAAIFVKGGAYNDTSSGQSDWYDSTHRYAVGQWTMHKSIQDTTPSYEGRNRSDQGVVTTLYKNSTSTSTSYSRSSSMSIGIYQSISPTSSVNQNVRFKSPTQMMVYVNAGTSNYGFLPGITYEYHIIYSE